MDGADRSLPCQQVALPDSCVVCHQGETKEVQENGGGENQPSIMGGGGGVATTTVSNGD